MIEITKEYYMVLKHQINRGTCSKVVHRVTNQEGNDVYYIMNSSL